MILCAPWPSATLAFCRAEVFDGRAEEGLGKSPASVESTSRSSLFFFILLYLFSLPLSTENETAPNQEVSDAANQKIMENRDVICDGNEQYPMSGEVKRTKSEEEGERDRERDTILRSGGLTQDLHSTAEFLMHQLDFNLQPKMCKDRSGRNVSLCSRPSLWSSSLRKSLGNLHSCYYKSN